MSDVRFEKVLFYYVEWQEVYRQLQYDIREKLEEQSWRDNTKATKKNIIEFRDGLPRPKDYLNDPLSPKLVIIDDLMREPSSCDTIVDLFTKGSHHKTLSVILISKPLPSGAWSTRYISQREVHRGFQKST